MFIDRYAFMLKTNTQAVMQLYTLLQLQTYHTDSGMPVESTLATTMNVPKVYVYSVSAHIHGEK
jgi:hypothetical protein